MLAGLRRDFRLAPWTFSLLAGAVLLFLAAEFSRGRGDDPMATGRRAFGFVETLALTADAKIYGPFDLWNGPWWRWWRIPASAFHHANLLHLVCNISMLWYLGPMLERRCGWWRYLLFWSIAAVVPFLPEYWLGHMPIGLSGVACAMFGWCVVEREFDSLVAGRVHEGFVKSTWMFLFGCVVATFLGIIHIANVAHFAGVGYGWLVARGARFRAWQATSWLLHAIGVPAGIWLALHPIWNGRYHAFVGLRAESSPNDRSIAERHLRRAVEIDPGLTLPWVRLTERKLQQNDLNAAWRIAVTGLKSNRSNKSLAEMVQDLWPLLSPEDRTAGREFFAAEFAGDTQAWIDRLKLDELPQRGVSDRDPLLDELIPKDFGLPRRNLREAPDVDPDQRDSAAEGQLL